MRRVREDGRHFGVERKISMPLRARFRGIDDAEDMGVLCQHLGLGRGGEDDERCLAGSAGWGEDAVVAGPAGVLSERLALVQSAAASGSSLTSS